MGMMKQMLQQRFMQQDPPQDTRRLRNLGARSPTGGLANGVHSTQVNEFRKYLSNSGRAK